MIGVEKEKRRKRGIYGALEEVEEEDVGLWEWWPTGLWRVESGFCTPTFFEKNCGRNDFGFGELKISFLCLVGFFKEKRRKYLH